MSIVNYPMVATLGGMTINIRLTMVYSIVPGSLDTYGLLLFFYILKKLINSYY